MKTLSEMESQKSVQAFLDINLSTITMEWAESRIS